MLTWFANYKDGSRHDYNAQSYNIANIDKSQLDTLIIHDPNDIMPTFVVHFDDEKKRPIYVRRVEMGVGGYKTVCHIVGWQMRVHGENIQSIFYVFETIGRKNKEGKDEDVKWIENAGKFDRNRNPWFKTPSEEQLNMLGSKVDGNTSS